MIFSFSRQDIIHFTYLNVLSADRSPLASIIGCSSFALLVDDNLVIHAKFALGHSTQVALHHHSARHVGAQDLAWTRAGGETLSLESKPGPDPRLILLN